ncbi:MAG: 2-oxoacid:acceptor oxidoreductase family protein [Candidatus Nealsonbacteria bacterium]|nr:2-oxoacid:acceptor oxidoreductase family protein [Candidatus Nealsonbacteria bacterium]
MIEITIFGRGGKGTRLASEILAEALFRALGDKEYSLQCFPFFGSERIGQPVEGFVRSDSKPIRLKCQIKQADYFIVLGADLLKTRDLKDNLKPSGCLIVNSRKTSQDLSRLYPGYRVVAFNASAIARYHNLNRLNTIMLGAFAKMTNLFSLADLIEIIQEKIPAYKKENIEATKEAYELAQPLKEA